MESQLDFCTLGMFIIDEIEYLGNKSRQDRIIGGAGTFAAIGARLVTVNPERVSFIVDVGVDFPPEFRSTIQSWQTSCVFRTDMTRSTTRAWNGYGENEHRAFKYLTPKLRLDEGSLSPMQLMAKAFHFVCSSVRCLSLVEGIRQRRGILASSSEASRQSGQQCLIAWEPVPELCVPEQLDKFKETIRHVDVVSPNSEELAGLFKTENSARSESQIAEEILGWGIGYSGRGTLVVRQGSAGCAVYRRGVYLHLRPYHLTPAKVLDPTGGGNTFLGAFAEGMVGSIQPFTAIVDQFLPATGRLEKETERQVLYTSILATIAAGYAIEQAGMPVFGMGLLGEELWNGEAFEERLVAYLGREEDYIIPQLDRIASVSS